ncbi:MAG: 2Fe-2S iron-sulfur cluster-binding protein [Bacillota bacterium]
MGHKVTFIKDVVTKKKKKYKILKVAKKNKVKIKAPCKKGKCKKCVVQVLEGKVSKPKKSEIKAFSKKELKKGYRLACKAKISSDAKIVIK